MPFMPSQILGIWLRGLFAVALLAAGAWLLYAWYDNRHVFVAEPRPVAAQTVALPDRSELATAPEPPVFRRVDWQFGLNRETGYLLGGLALVAVCLAGRWLSQTMLRRVGQDEPSEAPGGAIRRIRRPDGTELYVEMHGPKDGPPVILTHGWGLDSREWLYAQKDFSTRHRLIVWDLPGLGQSTSPTNKDWSLEKLARDLEAVLALAGDKPATLVGHSIGGMIILTFCRLFPEALGRRVSGLVLAQTTYTNPVRTMSWSGLYSALQKPVLEPLCHLMIWLAPLVWIMNWLSYQNGSAHRSTERTSFSGQESQGQLNFISGYYVQSWPGVVARGMLAMFRYDATAVLATIPIPVLVVAGDRDTTCTPEASAAIARAIPQATLLTLSPARHCGVFEHHDQCNTAVREFIASSATSPAKAAG